MKTFKDLQIGDKVYLGFFSHFVQRIEYINGYLRLTLHYDKDRPKCTFIGWDYYIPMNHINANNVKTRHGQLFISKKQYIKHMNKLIDDQIKR